MCIRDRNNLGEENLSVLQYKLAARGVRQLRDWLDSTGADYPTLRADGTPVPPPNHLPEIHFDLNTSSGTNLNRLSSGQINQLGVTLSLDAVGNNATFDANASNVGIASQSDTGTPNQQRRIDGGAFESIHFSFDRDVNLKSLDLTALEATSDEQIVLEFVSGDNPFINLAGYDSNGFTLTSDSLSLIHI